MEIFRRETVHSEIALAMVKGGVIGLIVSTSLRSGNALKIWSGDRYDLMHRLAIFDTGWEAGCAAMRTAALKADLFKRGTVGKRLA